MNNIGKFCSVVTKNKVTFCGLIIFENNDEVKILILKDDHPNLSLKYKTGSIYGFDPKNVQSIKPCWN